MTAQVHQNQQESPSILPAARKRNTLFSWIIHLLCMVSRFRALAKQRTELEALTDEQLDDIGLTREMADSEARKPFWVE